MKRKVWYLLLVVFGFMMLAGPVMSDGGHPKRARVYMPLIADFDERMKEWEEE